MMRNLTSDTFGVRLSTKQRNGTPNDDPFCQSTQQRKSWGHRDTKFVPCKKKFTRSCCAHNSPCATNRGKKLSTIELIVWWVAVFRAQLPSLCISGDSKCKFPHSFGRRGGGKNHKGKILL